jgi:hypothetical protein
MKQIKKKPMQGQPEDTNGDILQAYWHHPPRRHQWNKPELFSSLQNNNTHLLLLLFTFIFIFDSVS